MKKSIKKIFALMLGAGLLCSLAHASSVAEPLKVEAQEMDATEKYSNMKKECLPYYYPEATIEESVVLGDVTYYDAIKMPLRRFDDGCRVSFNLNKNYKTVSFEIGHIDGSESSSSSIVLSIYMDGKLYEQHGLKTTDLAKEITCDVMGVTQVDVVLNHDLWSGNADFAIGALDFQRAGKENALNLTKDSNMSEECVPFYLYDGLETQESFFMGGIQYTDVVKVPLRRFEGARRVVYNLQEKYSEVTFDVGHIDGSEVSSEAITVKVYKDSVLDVSQELNNYDIAKTFVCDVNGVSQFEIVIEYDTWSGNADYGIGAMCLKKSGEENANGKVIGSVFLNHCLPYSYDESRCVLNDNFMMGGIQYTNGMRVHLAQYDGEEKINFNLQKLYQTIEFDIGHIDGSENSASSILLTIYKDSEEDSTYTLLNYNIPQKIKLDVGGVSQLEIKITYDLWSGSASYGIGGIEAETIAQVGALELEQAVEADFFKEIDIRGNLKFAKLSPVSAKLLEIEAGKIVWSSSDESIVESDSITYTATADAGNGLAALKIHALPKKTGTVVISGKTSNGLTASCTVTIIYTQTVGEIFSDVYDDWYTDYIQYVYDEQLMTGIKGTSEFRPNVNVTKAQVAQVLYNMETQPTVTDKKVFRELKDVYEAEWYADAVAWAYNTGVVTGDLNTKKFSPNANVTREQLALMLYRYADYKGYSTTKTSNLAGLKNAENTSNWALEGVKWAVGTGLISGVEKNGVKDLQPQGNATRAQVAAILQRFCEENKLY